MRGSDHCSIKRPAEPALSAETQAKRRVQGVRSTVAAALDSAPGKPGTRLLVIGLMRIEPQDWGHIHALSYCGLNEVYTEPRPS